MSADLIDIIIFNVDNTLKNAANSEKFYAEYCWVREIQILKCLNNFRYFRIETHFYHRSLVSLSSLHSGDPLTLALPLMCLPLLSMSRSTCRRRALCTASWRRTRCGPWRASTPTSTTGFVLPGVCPGTGCWAPSRWALLCRAAALRDQLPAWW